MGNLCLQFVSEPAAPVPPDVQIRGDVNSFEMEEINGQSSTDAENTRGANAESPALEDDTSGSATVWKLTKRQEDDCEEIFSVFEDDEGKLFTTALWSCFFFCGYRIFRLRIPWASMML